MRSSDGAEQGAAVPNFAPDSATASVPDRARGGRIPATAARTGTCRVRKRPSLYSQRPRPIDIPGSGFEQSNLKPWAIAQMKKANDDVLAGKIPFFMARKRCWPGGVPAIDIYERDPPIYCIQTPKEVFVTEHDQQVRPIYLDVPHSENPKPSWYGESVGHYDGQNDKTFVVTA
jgi:hypothetical protein